MLEQLIERKKPGKDVAKPEVGLIEVATDMSEPLAKPNRRRVQPMTATPQRRHDHTHVHANANHLAHQRVSDLSHEIAVPLHHRCVGCLDNLSAPGKDIQHPIDRLGILRLEHAQSRLQAVRSVMGSLSTSKRGGSAGKLEISM